VPLFAFVSIRAVQARQTAKAWESDLGRHRRIIDVIREGHPAAAEFTVRAALQQFADSAYGIWQEAQ
jgi:DNA-binding FadR family transcriptional regulator